MASQGPIPKAFIILDLDYIHYHAEKNGIVMLGEVEKTDKEIK